MTDKLPPHLLRLFAPRPPLTYVKPLDQDPAKKVGAKISPLAQYASMLKDYDPDYVPTLSIAERKRLKAKEKKDKAEDALQNGLETWDPTKDDKAVGDPYKTLFISHVSHECTEKDLRREFEMYGPIENIRVVRDPNDKPKGYAFIEFEREKDMKAAYKDADGIKILGRRVLVDVERGRTVKGWKPKRLGGGLSNSRSGHDSHSSGRDYGGGRGGDRSRNDRDRGSSMRSSDRDRGRRGDDRSGGFRGGYSDRSYERDSKRHRSRTRSRSPRGYGDYR